jgi:23S rRNA (cytosine1962-C5)-methyltransferase
VDVRGLALELRATASGGVGLYPEHAANLGWLEARIRERLAAPAPTGAGAGADGPATAEGPPSVLNLFAHTGLATLAAARAGAAVAHVDAARASVAWARRNATLSDLDGRPIRWLVDDALAFVEREGRRGRRYAGFVIDPPSFGRAAGGRWSVREDLRALLDACGDVSAEDAFVLLTAHTTGLDPEPLLAEVARAFGRRPGEATAHRLALTGESGAILELGWAIRLA